MAHTASSLPSREPREGSQGPGAGQARRTLVPGDLRGSRGSRPPQPAGHTAGVTAPASLPSLSNHLLRVCLAGDAVVSKQHPVTVASGRGGGRGRLRNRHTRD